MRKRVVVQKEVGETPLQALQKWKKAHQMYEHIPACYAGRLDPMASGKLLVLVGDECKRQEKYHGLDKEYEVEVLLGVGSDTGDALGVVDYTRKETKIDPHLLSEVLQKETGVHRRPYPPYSSKTVQGKPLFLYALEGTLGTIQMPTHDERIYAIKHLSTSTIESGELKVRISDFLSKVPTTDEPSKALGADFRIEAVRRSWEELFKASAERKFHIVRITVTCGAGTYMRSLAGRLGEALHTQALALSIRRTRIGTRRAGLWIQDFR